MQQIPEPDLLNPDRTLSNNRADFGSDHTSREDLLQGGLRESCAYGKQLWQVLDQTRHYLMDSLPSDPRLPGPHRVTASPSGPDDEVGWQRWIDTYAEVNSALAGPHGDSGFGLSEARRAARLRREAPNLHVDALVEHERVTRPEASRGGPSMRGQTTASVLRAAGVVVLGLLVLRGLRVRQ